MCAATTTDCSSSSSGCYNSRSHGNVKISTFIMFHSGILLYFYFYYDFEYNSDTVWMCMLLLLQKSSQQINL